MINVNEIEANGFYFPGMSAEVATGFRTLIQGERCYPKDHLIINDEFFMKGAPCTYRIDGSTYEVQDVRTAKFLGTIVRLKENVFHKYFTETKEES